MDTETFAEIWAAPLATLPRSSELKEVNSDAIEFLSHVGLPMHAAYGNSKLPTRVSFARIKHGLVPFSRAVTLDFSPPSAWDPYYLIGQEKTEGGSSPFWCLHGESGHVVVIDVESDDDTPQFVNTSIRHLGDTLAAFRRWTRQNDSRDIARLEAALKSADADAWDDGGRWAILFDYLANDLDPNDIMCEPSVSPL